MRVVVKIHAEIEKSAARGYHERTDKAVSIP